MSKARGKTDKGTLEVSGEHEPLNEGAGREYSDQELPLGEQLSKEQQDGQLEPPVKIIAERNRRKPATIEEVRTIAKLMSFEDRSEVIGHIRFDLLKDLADEEGKATAAANAHQEKLSKLSALKGGI